MPKLFRLVDDPGIPVVMEVGNDYRLQLSDKPPAPVGCGRKARQLAEEIVAQAKAADNRAWLLTNFGPDANHNRESEPTGDFIAMVDEAAAQGLTYGEAYRLVARDYPRLYSEYRNEAFTDGSIRV